MRLGGCVEESRRDFGGRAQWRLMPLKAKERNAGTMWRVLVSTGLMAIPETIDAFRGIGEV
jgi:hypothetical protein